MKDSDFVDLEQEFNGKEIATQELPGDYDSGAESSPVESPAQNVDSPGMKASKTEQEATLETKKLLAYINKVTLEVNAAMSNCNDIQRVIKPVITQGDFIRTNLANEIARRGERALIYQMANVISNAGSTFHVADGNVKNIKFALGRIQDSIDEIKEKLEEEE